MIQQFYTPQQIYRKDRKTLQESLKTIKKPFTIKSKSQLWAAYVYYKLNEENLNILYSDELSSCVSKFATGTPYPDFKCKDLNLEKLENNILNMYNLNLENLSPLDAYKETINYIFNIFISPQITDFELINDSIIVYLKKSEMDKLGKVPGDSNRQKFIKLLENY